MFELSTMLLLLLLIFLTSLLFFFTKISKPKTKSKTTSVNKLPKPYPIIGHLLAFFGLTQEEIFEWLSMIMATSSSSTIVVHNPFGDRSVFTGDPACVEHILKTKFHIYEKGPIYKIVFRDLFGDSLFTENGDAWKFQRQMASQEFTHKALQKFVENVVKFEIVERLIPFLSDAAKKNKIIDLQDLLKRFAFDNISTITFGYDPGYVTPSLEEAKLATAFEESITICHKRFYAVFPIVWKACRLLNIGSEKRLKELVLMLRTFVKSMIDLKKQNLKSEEHENDFLSKVLKSDKLDEKLIIDMMISFIFAGLDTTSAVLTWFFWLLHNNNHVEQEIINEINNNESKTKQQGEGDLPNPSSSSVVDELKRMTYTHAALSETMRLYPPVPIEVKQPACDDVLPDGTKVKKGSNVGFFSYAMGRSEKIWGSDWPEFRPERWLREEKDHATGKTKRSFVSREAYSYPVFLAGPRICLGKEMAFLQMKSVVAAVLSRFKVIPVVDDGFKPVYVPETTAKMHGGFPVRIQDRVQVEPSDDMK